ncbi:hypothetical protein SAMN04487830_12229 [Pseudobutyrivibrio sp. OR37]|uniref:hypothetical protein n=1 Tax=Pseudobutyrivibrio sp. OR37 TaxID=1798186 RepID=UPI0008E52D22|nr:hypothetical protein [Pseudobutyrivibrio sp. OR37]SFI09830.1 hypothetical protein SAMN04487830_12229 [Pseudobutyrivibrio sp. OR37]
MIDKRNCTAITTGKIKELRSRGLNKATMIIVEYCVDGVTYEVQEGIKLKSEAIKIGFIPIGQKKSPVMGDVSVGSNTSISYNPQNPAEAFITNNRGFLIA